MKKSIALTNVITSILLQFFTIIYGFIIPKLIISYFGSEVNGLVASITQLLGYISLVEGGITAVIISKLYSPLIKGDFDEVNSIVNTGIIFFRKIGLAFLIYSILLSIVSPFIYMKNGFSYIYIFSLTLILSISLLIQYMMSLGLKCLLNADKKIYFISITQILIIITNIVLAYISIKIYPQIHIFKLLTGITFLIQPLMYSAFTKKNYKLSKDCEPNLSLIKDRWNGFANNLAYFIHSSTDITILTFITDLVTVSVYSVYALVTNGLKSLIGAINSGIFSSIGHLYARGNFDNLEKKFDLFEYIYLIIVFYVFTIASLLITPFVVLYVGKVNASNIYYQPVFGYLLLIAVMLDLIKVPHVNLAYAANKFKEITIPCFIEAFINIIISIILVFNYGLIGVSIGTICAMLYRIIFQVYFTKKIINRNQRKFYKTFIVLLIGSSISVAFCNLIYKIDFSNLTICSWVVHALLYSFICAFVFLIISIIFFKNKTIKIFNYIKGEREL